jgi:hypothetical protein
MLMSHLRLRSKFPQRAMSGQRLSNRQWITSAVRDRAGNVAADEGSMPADSMRLPEVGFRYLRLGSSVSS